MREILFRGKAANREEGRAYRTNYKNGDWVYGLLTDSENYCGFAEMTNIDGVSGIEVDKETVCQFTGLLDKNGNKIFEGDIIDASSEWWYAAGYAGHDSPIILVQWNDRECGFAPFSTYDSDCGVDIRASRCEVIGNIYDNPEIEWCE